MNLLDIDTPSQDDAQRTTPAKRGPFTAAAADIAQGFTLRELWTALAHDDMRQRFKRTAFGLLWLTISYAVFVGAKVAIFGQMITAPLEWFAVYVAVGFLAWQFMYSAMVDGCTVFINSENWLLGMRVPLSVFVFESLARESLVFFYSAVVALLVILLFGHSVTWVALMAAPAFAIYLINAVSVHFLLGVLCMRYRDLAQLIQTVMRVLFFLTPLVWTPEQIGPGIRQWLWWNPFTYMVDIFRAPIVDGVVPLQSWAIVIAITLVLGVSAFVVFAMFRRKLVFWF